MPPKPNLTRKQAGEQATYFCPGCHAQERGLDHGIHCPTLTGKKYSAPAPKMPAGDWDDLVDDLDEAT